MEDEIDYDENNYGEDYLEEYIEEEDNIKDDKKEKRFDDLYKKPSIDFEIMQYSEVIKKRDEIIEEFINFSCLNYDEA